jgi:hypothetical protein
MNRTIRWLAAAGGGLLLMLGSGLAFFPSQAVDFNRDIRPLLNSRCIACHGGVKQSGGLSFLTREEALLPAESGKAAIVPGDPENSELIRRVLHHDPEERMPLDQEPLKPEEISLLKRWIEQGAPWALHWAFIPPSPDIQPPRSAWGQPGIDGFIAQRLREEGLRPAPEADKITLIRRASLDLTGLPPSLEAVDVFLADSLPGSYERLIDRLLASPHFGERWAAHWMDLARYADSKGYESDPHRDLWPYRDWLIQAFNRDLPFDQLSIEQLAGDLLPEAGQDALVATAFHRSTLTNAEGGTDDEEFRVAAVLDRVRTTWTVWQGITMECAQCHSHPYEPIRQKEYFQSYAFFNTSQDNDLNDEFPFMEVFPPSDSLQAGQIFDWFRKYVPAYQDTTRLPVGERFRRALFPRLLPGDCDDFREVTLTADGAASNWVHNLQSGSQRLFYLRFNNVDFSQIDHITLTYAAAGSESEIELRRDAPDGPLLAQFRPGRTGYIRDNEGWWDEPDRQVRLRLAPAEGRHDLFVLLHNRSGQVPGGIVVLKALELSGPALPSLSPAARAAQDSLLRLRLRTARLPIMKERQGPQTRVTRLFERGSWLAPGDTVLPGTPSVMPPLPSGVPADRLALARWLVSPENPLTARVTVNRFWEQIFGAGIVETVEDFGSQGAKPSHPELLDWLALRFMREHRWSVKSLLREMVLSSTYRQSAASTPLKQERDPFNRLLSRGPRFRLSAEQVRDQALAVSGLLRPRLYGPSVMPWQPEGIWKIVYSGSRWELSEGGDAYRRALYTYWRRSSPYPSLLGFDAASRDYCLARRLRTNTPLQALTTLNDPVYHEAALGLAEQMMRSGGIAYGYRRALLRAPSPTALQALQQLHDRSLAYYEAHPQEAAFMACNEREDSPRLAALAVVANAILNLDEFLTR